MVFHTLKLAAIFVVLILAELAQAQHCGGPCEVPRGADPVSSNPRYTLSEGIEVANWRYLFNWFWTVDGVQKFRVEEALKSVPARDFGFRRMFVSPSGNGFLVTGNPYTSSYKVGKTPPLFVFVDPEGKLISELSLFQALTAEERKLGPCPNCDCDNVLYVFAQDPSICEDGVFVELTPYRTSREISFFLPFGCPIRERGNFEEALEAAEWSRLSADEAASERDAIKGLVNALKSDDLKLRSEAAAAILAKGYLARKAVSEAMNASSSGNFRARSLAVLKKMRPLGGLAWEAMSTDLGLLGPMLSYSEPEVALVVRQRLQQIVPQLKEIAPHEYGGWIKNHRMSLKWNQSLGHYEE